MEEFARGSWPQSWLLLFLAAPAVLLLKQWLTPSALSKIPLVGLEIGNEEARRLAYLAGAKSIYQAGYEQVRQGSAPTACDILTVWWCRLVQRWSLSNHHCTS